MTLAISKALEAGVSTVICASTGNTAASAAAYAARAGLRAVVLQPHGAVAAAKVAQAGALGARVVQVRGSFDDALARRAHARRPRHARPRQLAQPVSHRGAEDGRVRDRRGSRTRTGRARAPVRRRREHPRLRAWVRGGGRGPAALVAGEAAQRRDDARVRDPDRRTGARGGGCRGRARVGREGRLRSADEAILQAWRDLAREEGVLCEPSSAAGLAALVEAGVEPGARVVCVLTGHGLKDSETAARESAPPVVVDADPDAIAEAAS